jgi:5-methylcytosine-specific restriction endonuclease McrA
MPLCLKCKNKFPNWIKIEGKARNLSSRKFCLECSPFGKHNTIDITKTDIAKTDIAKGFKFCPKCEHSLPRNDFYTRKRNNNASPYCKKCTTLKTLERQRKFKCKCVDHKGGECRNCGYKKYVGAMEFHHRNNKDFAINNRRFNKIDDVLIAELNKCELLCANCHREEHIRDLTYEREQIAVDSSNHIICVKCFRELPESYIHQYGICRGCYNRGCTEAARRLKQKCTEYCGYCCSVCGYKKYIGALEFHHTDPKHKDIKIASLRRTFEKMKKELDKCILLCANCHREEHARIKGLLEL